MKLRLAITDNRIDRAEESRVDLAEEAENEAGFIHHEQSSQPCEELKIVHFIHHKHTTQPRDGE